MRITQKGKSNNLWFIEYRLKQSNNFNCPRGQFHEHEKATGSIIWDDYFKRLFFRCFECKKSGVDHSVGDFKKTYAYLCKVNELPDNKIEIVSRMEQTIVDLNPDLGGPVEEEPTEEHVLLNATDNNNNETNTLALASNNEEWDENRLKVLAQTDVQAAFDYINMYHVHNNENGKWYSRKSRPNVWNMISIDDFAKSLKEITALNGTPIVDLWLKTGHKRRIAGFIFDPNPISNSRFINTYTGFSVPASTLSDEEVQAHMQIYEDHVVDIICNGDRNLAKYFLDHLARIVQRPWIKSKIAFILTSQHGAGKGVVFQPLTDIICL
jgi:hypothetical protein